MKPLSIALTCLIAIFTLEAEAQDDPYMSKTFNVSGPGDLVVETSGGSIGVEGYNGSEVKVDVYVKPNGGWSLFGSDDDDIEEILEDYTISVEQKGSTVTAIAERKGSGWGNSKASISFQVKVPTTTSCELSTSGGSIDLANVEGAHDVNTSGGGLDFRQISGTTEAHTSGGGINVREYMGVLSAHTSGGSINVDRANGNVLLRTSGGSIDLENIVGTIEASTSGGSIDANIEQLGEFVKLSTSGGSITATLPKGQGLDLELSGNRVNTKLVNFTGESDKNSINGSINGGGVLVNMHTSGGSVSLDYQDPM